MIAVRYTYWTLNPDPVSKLIDRPLITSTPAVQCGRRSAQVVYETWEVEHGR
jgi:hypothetical protein